MSGKSSRKAISQPADHVGFWLGVLSNGIAGSFEKALAKHGVSIAQWAVLRALYGRESSLNELSQAIGLEQGSTSRLVERLVQKKLVNRIIPPEDRRSVRVSLTSSAVDLVPELASTADVHDGSFFGKIGKTKKDQLLKIVMELIQKHDIRHVAIE